MNKKAIEACNYIHKLSKVSPTIGLVLGSGLGDLVNELEQPLFIRYETIPHFPVSTVSGHAGQLAIGQLFETNVAMLQGRFHFYEGYSLKDVVFPIKVLKLLGVKQILITNAAGGINRSFSAGDLMLITDHLQFMNDKQGIHSNQLRTFNPQSIYSNNLINKAENVSRQTKIPLTKGIYAAMSGPSYETPAEIKLLHKLGADAVGMSTAPEAQFAYESNMEVLGISCISNMAAGILDEPLSHEEVIETTERVQAKFTEFMNKLVKEIARKDDYNG